jgi:hypothetical protein
MRPGIIGLTSNRICMKSYSISTQRLFIAVALAGAIAGCSGMRPDGSANTSAGGPLPAAASPALSSLPKPGTLFASIFAGSLPGTVAISQPPYSKEGGTYPIRGPVNIALAENGALIVATTSLFSSPSPLYIIRSPYNSPPKVIDQAYWAGDMVLDQNDDIFMAQKPGHKAVQTFFKEYLAPTYTKSIQWGELGGRYVSKMAALPNGLIAVGSVREGKQNATLPGELTIYHPPYKGAATRISSLQFVTAMTVVPKGLIVLVCASCFGSTAGGTYLALVAPPYKTATKLATIASDIPADGMTSSAAGDIFVKEGSTLYHYTAPYSKGVELTNATSALESMAVAPNGDLFYGALNGTGPHGQFAVNRLKAPYSGEPTAIFGAFGPPGQMAVWK